MSVFSYRMEHVMGDLNYWTDLMTRWGVGWIAGSEHKAHGKMASLFAQPYISPPDYDTVDFPSKKEIILVQQSAVDEFERCQQGSAVACQEVPPQQVDAGGMRMMNNALWIPEWAVELQLRSCVEATASLQGLERAKRRLAQSRSMCLGQRLRRMSRSLCRTVCTVSRLFL
jgi:hypothetical protein